MGWGGDGAGAGADQLLLLVLEHHRLELRDLNHVVPHRRWNDAGQSGSPAASDARPVENHVLGSLGGE